MQMKSQEYTELESYYKPFSYAVCRPMPTAQLNHESQRTGADVDASVTTNCSAQVSCSVGVVDVNRLFKSDDPLDA